jgi:hypothetical protein
MVMNGVDLPTVKEILGHSEINMTMRYSHLAPAHKAKAVQQLGDALEQIQQGPLDQQAEAATVAQTATNLAHFRHVLVVKSGRGLSVIGPKTEQNQRVNSDQKWWRRGESHLTRKCSSTRSILSSKHPCCPQSCPHELLFVHPIAYTL